MNSSINKESIAVLPSVFVKGIFVYSCETTKHATHVRGDHEGKVPVLLLSSGSSQLVQSIHSRRIAIDVIQVSKRSSPSIRASKKKRGLTDSD